MRDRETYSKRWSRDLSISHFVPYRVCALALPLFLASRVVAQDGAVAAGDPETQVQNAIEGGAKEAGSLVMRSLDGDTDAMLELGTDFAIPAVVALLLVVIGYLVSAFVGRLVGRTIAKRVDETLGKFFGKMVKTIMMVMVLLSVLGYFGIDVTSFAAVLAAAGFAIGMALQGTLSNFAAGVMILVFRPFTVGDFISAAGSSGTVDEVDLFTTRLNTADNRYLIVPNSAIFASTIENVTHHDTRRVDVSVGVDYAADLQHVRGILTDATRGIDGILPDPAPVVVLTELGDSSVNWQVRVWSLTGDFWGVKERLTESVKTHLDAADIGIPYPTMDVHLANMPPTSV